MNNQEWNTYFTKRRAEVTEELDGFKRAIAKYGLRLREHDVNGERDVTDAAIRKLEEQIREYERMLQD